MGHGFKYKYPLNCASYNKNVGGKIYPQIALYIHDKNVVIIYARLIC